MSGNLPPASIMRLRYSVTIHNKRIGAINAPRRDGGGPQMLVLKWWTLATMALVLCVASSTELANAALIGSTVNVSANYPDQTTVLSDGGDTTVSSAIEYPEGTFVGYNPIWSVDITDDQFILHWNNDGGASFGSADFNGFVLTIISGPALLAAVADPASDFNPGDISINGNQLFLNYEGGSAPPFGSSIIDIATSAVVAPVPEPASILLLTSGFASWVTARRIAKRVGERKP